MCAASSLSLTAWGRFGQFIFEIRTACGISALRANSSRPAVVYSANHAGAWSGSGSTLVGASGLSVLSVNTDGSSPAAFARSCSLNTCIDLVPMPIGILVAGPASASNTTGLPACSFA